MRDTSWPGVEIASWRAFLSHALDHIEADDSSQGFVYRGQDHSDHALEPSLLRAVPIGSTLSEILALERDALLNFQRDAHQFIGREHRPDDSALLEWWSLMQHFGAPTRLLDWTQSPFVAAYFAVAGRTSDEGVVYAVHVGSARKAFSTVLATDWKARVANEDAPHAIEFWSPAKRTVRAASQQGLFSIAVRADGSHGALREACQRHKSCLPAFEPARVWLFPPKVKREVLRGLRTMNIGAHSLFPGLDGLGRSVGEILRAGKPPDRAIVIPHVPSGSLTLQGYAPSVSVIAADALNRQNEGLFGRPEFPSEPDK